jgi:hypothetical protein
VPRISEFFGIVIRMNYNDRSPPHFHAQYTEDEAIYELATIEVLRGRLPRRAHALAVEWTTLHRVELRAHWDRARTGSPLHRIEPLD